MYVRDINVMVHTKCCEGTLAASFEIEHVNSMKHPKALHEYYQTKCDTKLKQKRVPKLLTKYKCLNEQCKNKGRDVDGFREGIFGQSCKQYCIAAQEEWSLND